MLEVKCPDGGEMHGIAVHERRTSMVGYRMLPIGYVGYLRLIR
jgi:hypothetical protein